MKQHMLNRIISFVLVFVLLVGLLPAGALAANTKDPGFSIEEIPAALSFIRACVGAGTGRATGAA